MHVSCLHHLLVSDFLKLHVLLDHHFLEGLEVVDVEDLLDDFVVGRVGGALLASRLKLFSRDPHFSHKLTKEVVDHAVEVHVDVRVFELVLVLVVKGDAVLLDVAYDGHFPSRAL